MPHSIIKITSLYISKGNKLIHSSNNVMQFQIDQQTMEPALKCLYPLKATIKAFTGPETMKIEIKTKAIIDRKDLLTGINPVLSFLIKSLLSRPAYIGLEAECQVTLDDQPIHGFGIIESMIFRSK